MSSYPMSLEDTKMHMSNESLLIILGVGLIAGWLAGQIVQGTGFGIVGDLIIGRISPEPRSLHFVQVRKMQKSGFRRWLPRPRLRPTRLARAR